MAKRSYSLVRAERRRWGFSQAELAGLLGIISPTTVSRIERAVRPPSTEVLIACSILFGSPAPELFSSLHRDLEEVVGTAAKALLDELMDKTDKQSARKREFLEAVLARLISANRTRGL